MDVRTPLCSVLFDDNICKCAKGECPCRMLAPQILMGKRTTCPDVGGT